MRSLRSLLPRGVWKIPQSNKNHCKWKSGQLWSKWNPDYLIITKEKTWRQSWGIICMLRRWNPIQYEKLLYRMLEYTVICRSTLLNARIHCYMYMSEYIGVLVVYIKEHMLLDVKSFISQDSTVFKLTAFCSKNLCKFINEDYFVLTSIYYVWIH